ncbi:MAG: hypothetical protein QF707_01665 [Candidatus Poseidoniaceae archaeon]|jgi:hypothetical protein|nr:hypothetical protein [Candidatus Poseidoniaceae archaeon]MDP7202955.1 hypothetical protein [Candidatus Poseidoniaceae archaeon]
MVVDLPELLLRCGIEWDDSSIAPEIPPGPIVWVGRVLQSSQVERSLWDLIGPDVWRAENEWPGLSASDLERWLVDAPVGDHVIILQGNDRIPDVGLPSSVRILSRVQLATALGEHLLDGGSFISMVPETIPESGEASMQRVSSGPLGITPCLRPDDILEELGFTGLGLSPLHLEARIWTVSGMLCGPEGQEEPREWKILEDPWEDELSLIDELELLSNPPDLEVKESVSFSSDSMLRMRLVKMLSERRASGLEEGSGVVLKRWRATMESSQMKSQKIYIPAWRGNLPGHGDSILHGLSGKLFSH